MSPLRKNTFCPSRTSSPVKTTSPPGPTTLSGIGGWPLYVRYANIPRTKNPNKNTSTVAWIQPLEISNPRRSGPPIIGHLQTIKAGDPPHTGQKQLLFK